MFLQLLQFCPEVANLLFVGAHKIEKRHQPAHQHYSTNGGEGERTLEAQRHWPTYKARWQEDKEGLRHQRGPFSDRRWAPTFVTDLGAALFDVVLDRTVYVIRE